ncbi:MAG: hypothetical protein AAGJ08_26290 [Cyanobacteria bacterium P01_H01_bin.35]
MNNDREKFLLSLLLALTELNSDNPLSLDENKGFKNVAAQLEDDQIGTAWEQYTKPKLTEIINNNLSLKTRFDEIRCEVDKIENIPQYLIPKAEDLATVTPTKNQPQERPLPNISQADLKSNEIINMSIQIISSPEPSETVKKISKFEKLLNWIRQNRSDNT